MLIVAQLNLSRVQLQQSNLFEFAMVCTAEIILNNVLSIVIMQNNWPKQIKWQKHWIVGAALLHLSSVVNYLLSRLSQSEVHLCFNNWVSISGGCLTTLQLLWTINCIFMTLWICWMVVDGDQPLTLNYQTKPNQTM